MSMNASLRLRERAAAVVAQLTGHPADRVLDAGDVDGDGYDEALSEDLQAVLDFAAEIVPPSRLRVISDLQAQNRWLRLRVAELEADQVARFQNDARAVVP